MRIAVLLLGFMVIAAGCVGQQPEEEPAEFKITEVSLTQGEFLHNESVEMFITIKSFDERELEASVELSADREGDAPYLEFDPARVDYGALKKGEEIKKSFSVKAFVAAGERTTYKFNVNLIVNSTITDSKERMITVARGD